MVTTDFDDWAQHLYLNEVILQCAFIERAYDLIVANVRGDAGQPPDHTGLAFAINAFLASAATLSRFVYPPPTGSKADDTDSLAFRKVRGQALAELLDLSPDSPIRSREVRNGLEHMDEYLDRWVIHQHRPTAEQLESGSVPQSPPEPRSPLRQIDPGRLLVRFYDVVVDIEAVTVEARRIRQRALELVPYGILDPSLMVLLARVPPFPKELRFDAPTRRPDESVTARPSDGRQAE